MCKFTFWITSETPREVTQQYYLINLNHVHLELEATFVTRVVGGEIYVVWTTPH